MSINFQECPGHQDIQESFGACPWCEIDRLRAEVEGLRDDMAKTTGLLVRANAEIARLRAENERLRSAIRSALPHIHLYGNEGRAHDLLEAALGGGEARK